MALTDDEFKNAKQIQEWWQGVVDNPFWSHVKDQLRRHRRWTEVDYPEIPHVSSQADGYIKGFQDSLDILDTFCHPVDGAFVSSADETQDDQPYEQDEDLADKTQNRFNG
jgi:hypothetical protein